MEGSGGPFWLTARGADGLQVLPVNRFGQLWGAGAPGAGRPWDRPEWGPRATLPEPVRPTESGVPPTLEILPRGNVLWWSR